MAESVPADHDQRLQVLLKEFFEPFFPCFFPAWSANAWASASTFQTYNQRRLVPGSGTRSTFTLILSGVAELTPERADALYAATQGDIELNLRDGVAFVEFERTAATLREAISNAIREVEEATVVIRVVRVESETANVIAKINAELLGMASS